MMMPYSKLQVESGMSWQKTEEGLRMFRETSILEQTYHTRCMLLGRIQRTLSPLGNKEYLSEGLHL